MPLLVGCEAEMFKEMLTFMLVSVTKQLVLDKKISQKEYYLSVF